MVLEDNGNILGFSASTKKSKGFNKRFIKENLFTFGLIYLKLLLFSPKSLFRLLRNLTKKSNTVDDNNYAELYSIAFIKNAQVKGVGKGLLKASELEMRVYGVKHLSLT